MLLARTGKGMRLTVYELVLPGAVRLEFEVLIERQRLTVNGVGVGHLSLASRH
jgi:hypothetical protein